MLTRGRVLRAGDAANAALISRQKADASRGRRIPSAVASAVETAQNILQHAETEAARVRAEAERQAAELRLAAHEVGRAEAAATLAAWSVHLARAEADGDERSLDRCVALAQILAERLLGTALSLDPSVVTKLARQALDEARGTRLIRLTAHPEDAAILRGVLAEIAASSAATIVDEPSFSRGDLRLETELGSLDARLGPRLDRLSRRLRESLRR